MQFNLVAVVLAMASAAAAGAAVETTTIYACPPDGVASATGGTAASTGVVTAPTPTGSPIMSVTGAGSMNAVSVFGMIVAGGVALLF